MEPDAGKRGLSLLWRITHDVKGKDALRYEFQLSNSIFGIPDWRIIDAKVPGRNVA